MRHKGEQMTEDEVKAMDELIDAIHVDTYGEIEWIVAQLNELEQTQQKLVSVYKLHKFLRDEKQMKASYDDLKRINSCIDYLKRRRQEIHEDLGPENEKIIKEMLRSRDGQNISRTL